RVEERRAFSRIADDHSQLTILDLRALGLSFGGEYTAHQNRPQLVRLLRDRPRLRVEARFGNTVRVEPRPKSLHRYLPRFIDWANGTSMSDEQHFCAE